MMIENQNRYLKANNTQQMSQQCIHVSQINKDYQIWIYISQITRVMGTMQQLILHCKDNDFQKTIQIDSGQLFTLERERDLLAKELQMSNKRLEEFLQGIKTEKKPKKSKIDPDRNSQQIEKLPVHFVNRATQSQSENLFNINDDYKIHLTEAIKKDIGLVPKHAECHKEQNRLNAELLDNKKLKDKLQAELQTSKRKVNSLQQQLSRNVSETRRLKLNTLSYEQTINQLQRDVNSFKSKSTKDNQLISAKNKQLTQKNQQLQKENQSLKAKINANRNDQNSESIPAYLVHRATKFFSGDVLDQFDDYKIYLTNVLEKEMDITIKRTQMLFRYQKAFPRNLHQLIDGHSPIVVLLKTVKGYHIACVSQAPFTPRSNKQGRGWLISLTKGHVYRAAAGKQAIIYDDMNLIFGDQEIRIDGSSNRVFSNFGISNSFYNTTGNDVRDFLGPGLEGTPREAELESFEIFKLYPE